MLAQSHVPGGKESNDEGQDSKSELTKAEIKLVNSYSPDQDLIDRVRNILIHASYKVHISHPTEDVVLKAAQIMGALGDKRITKTNDGEIGYWLLTEAYLNTGKDPSTIFHHLLMSALEGGSSSESPRVEAIKAKILELEKQERLPVPAKPENEADPEAMKQYRLQLVSRHLKERLGQRNGLYSAGNMESLYEIMMMMADSSHPDFKKLYDQVAKKLTAGGAQVERYLCKLKENQLTEMAQLVADSSVPIKPETTKESMGYPAEDLCISTQIYDLYQQLSDEDKFYFRIEKQLKQDQQIDHGAMQPYVDLILQSRAGLLGGGDQSICNFSLKNKKRFELYTNPYSTKLKPGEIMIVFRNTMGDIVDKQVVSDPAEALELIKNFEKTK